MVSIIIPCYNRKELLERCVRAFLNQTYSDWELIVVDDGSEEDLKFVLKIDERIRYVRQEHMLEQGNGYGAPRARNLGKSAATGKYILVFDSDDVPFDNLLLRCVSILDKYPQFDVVYTDHINFKNKKITGDVQKYYDCNNTEFDYLKMLECQFIPGPGTLWRKDRMPDYDLDIGSAEDWDLILTAMEKKLKFFHLPETLWAYHIGGHEQEYGSKRQTKACERVLGKRGYAFDPVKKIGYKL